MKRWAKQEDLILTEFYTKNGAKWCGQKLGRSEQSVRSHIIILKRPTNNVGWSEEHDLFLREKYHGGLLNSEEKTILQPSITRAEKKIGENNVSRK